MSRKHRSNRIVSISADGYSRTISTYRDPLAQELASARYDHVVRMAQAQGWSNSPYHTYRPIDQHWHRKMHKAADDAQLNRY